MQQPLLTVNEVMARLSCSRATAYNVMSVQLAAYVVRVGRLIRLPQEALDNYIGAGGDTCSTNTYDKSTQSLSMINRPKTKPERSSVMRITYGSTQLETAAIAKLRAIPKRTARRNAMRGVEPPSK